MKKYLLILSAVIGFFASCTSVKFEASQPMGLDELKEFPQDIVGTYVKSNDTLIITNNAYKCGNKKSVYFSQDTLCPGKTILKKHNDFYVLSTRDKSGEDVWEVTALKKVDDNLMLFYILVGEKNKNEIINKLREIVAVKEVRSSEGKLDYYLINPTVSEFDILLKKEIFSLIVEYKKVK